MAHIHQARMGEQDTQVLSYLDPAQATAAGFPLEAVVGTVPAGTPMSPDALAVNPTFLEYLHATVAERGPAVPTLAAAARKQATGYIYILDLRTPAGDNVPAEDVIGYFEVQEGAMRAEGYRRNPAWQPLTPVGAFRFPGWLTELLRANLPAG